MEANSTRLFIVAIGLTLFFTWSMIVGLLVIGLGAYGPFD